MHEPDPDLDRDPIELLAEDFLERFRRGERPGVEEYAARHPEVAEQIRELLPALVMLEQEKSVAGPAAGEAEPHAVPRQLGDYLILREIGRGGMGVVYESVQRSLGRHVALKVLPRRQLSGSSQLERFRLEARAAARLQHGNIVPVYGVGEYEGMHYYAMQFIRGQALDLVIDALRGEAGGPPGVGDSRPPTAELSSALLAGTYGASPSDDVHERPGASASDSFRSTELPAGGAGASYHRSVARIGAQVAEALAHAHRHGILHRDVKPSNLLLDAGGTVWVTDFGLAKAEEGQSLTETGDIVGTLRYMAPERFEGWSDPRSDVYALGATLYELTTLRAPFPETDRVRLIRQVVHGAPVPPHRLDRRVPRDLETIILKAMAREPGHRYTTAELMADDLSRFVAGRPILARRTNALKRTWLWCRRQPLLAAAVGSVAAAGVAVAVLSLRYADQQHRFATSSEQATRRISVLANELREERESLRSTLAESNELLAAHDLDRGRAACEQGQVGQGLLWMIESWRSAVAARDPARQQAARASLAEWRPYLPRLRAVLSHSGPVEAVAFSPDGKTIVTGGDDRTARLWDLAGGTPVGLPMEHEAEVTSVAFHPDGRTILTGSNDHAARLWDAATGKACGPPLRLGHPVAAVAFLDQGRTFLTGENEGSVLAWETATGRPLGTRVQHSGPLSTLAVSSDGTILLTAGVGSWVRLWDAGSGRPLGPELLLRGFVRAATLSGDGTMAVVGDQGGSLQICDLAVGRRRDHQSRPHADRVRAVAFSPDGRLVVTGSTDKTARLLDAATLEPLGRPIHHDGPVVAAAFSPDGRWFVTASSDHTARVWDANPVQPLGRPLDGSVRAAYAPEGGTLVVMEAGGNVRPLQAETGRWLGPPSAGNIRGSTLAVLADGKTLFSVVDANHSQRWDVSSGLPIGEALSHPGMNVDAARAVAVSPDGKTILLGGQDRTIRLWDATTGKALHSPIPQPGTVDAVAFSPDGKGFAVGLDSGVVRLWDLATLAPLGDPFPHSGCVSSVAFSPDGRTLVTGCEDGMARLWDVASRTLRLPPLRHPGWVWSVEVSPDGREVLTGCEDGGARLWDLATGVPLGPVLALDSPVWLAHFSPDGKTLLADARAYRRTFLRPADLPDELERIAAWVEVLTGLTLDPRHGSIEIMDGAAWRAARTRLERLGGEPPTGSDQLLDPIVFGPNPAERLRWWEARGQQAQARAARDELLRARPSLAPILLQQREAIRRTSAPSPPRPWWSGLADLVRSLSGLASSHPAYPAPVRTDSRAEPVTGSRPGR